MNKPTTYFNITTPRIWRTVTVIVCLAFSLVVSHQAIAQKLSPAEAASSARQSTGGKILKVRPLKNGSTDYRIKVLLPEGRVRNIIIDGNNGQLKRKKNN